MDRGEILYMVMMFFAPFLGVLLIVALPPPFNYYVGFPGYFAIDVFLVVGLNYLSQLRANMWSFLKLRVKKTTYPNGKSWKGQFTYRYKDHPESIGRIKDYVAPDGHTDPVVYVTECRIPKLARVFHPYFNGGGPLPGFYMIHPAPYDDQFPWDSEGVVFARQSVAAGHVSWGTVVPIQAQKFQFRNPMSGQRGHVSNRSPFVDRELKHWPWLYVSDSAGMTDYRVRQAPIVPMKPLVVVSKQGEGLSCPKCSYEGKERVSFKVEGKMGRCANGHELNMP